MSNRGPKVQELLVTRLGLPQNTYNTVSSRIRAFLVASTVGIHHAKDEDLTSIAHAYMGTPDALTFFSGTHQLNFQWSVERERAKIEEIVKSVMELQQSYAIDKKHQVDKDSKLDCAGCRIHAPPPAVPFTTKLRDKRWTFRDAEHQAQALGELAEWQIEVVADVLSEEYYEAFAMLFDNYEDEVEGFLTGRGAESELEL